MLLSIFLANLFQSSISKGENISIAPSESQPSCSSPSPLENLISNCNNIKMEIVRKKNCFEFNSRPAGKGDLETEHRQMLCFCLFLKIFKAGEFIFLGEMRFRCPVSILVWQIWQIWQYSRGEFNFLEIQVPCLNICSCLGPAADRRPLINRFKNFKIKITRFKSIF